MARRQREKTRQTREELMASAMEVFGDKGFAAATIAEITESAGYAKGNFYRYWTGKDDILLEIIGKKLGEYREERRRRMAAAGSLEEVLDIIWDFLESILADRNWSRVFLEFAVRASRDAALRAMLHNSVYRLSNATFAELVRGHVQSDYPPEKMGALNTALFEGYLIQSVLDETTINAGEARQAAKDLIMSRARAGQPE